MSISEVSPYSWMVSIVVSVTFIIVGWGVIYWNARKIATRSETKSLLDKATTQLEDATKLATEYWLSGRRDRLDHDHFQLLFMAQISRLGVTVEILKHRGLGISFDGIATLSESGTLDCELANSMPKEDCHLRGHEINQCSMELTQHFMDCFHNHYKPNGTKAPRS